MDHCSLMLILENLLGLKSKQVDVTAAFIHATLIEDEKSCVKMPLGFKQHGYKECSRFFVSRKISLACIKVLMPSGNTSLRKLVAVAFLKLHLTTASLSVEWSLSSAMLMKVMKRILLS